MTRAELAELAGPKFLLCTPGWMRGSVYGLGAVALVGGGALALSGFHAEPIEAAKLCIGVLVMLLGLAIFNKKSRDWRSWISLGADTGGIYLVPTRFDSECLHVPWADVGQIDDSKRLSSGGKQIYGIVFELRVTDEAWARYLNSQAPRRHTRDASGFFRFGLSANGLRPREVRAALEQLRSPT
jgi:hypothetical protein